MSREERDWLIRQISDRGEARGVYDWYKERGLPSLMFWNTFMADYLVCGYATDNEHIAAGREVPLSTYIDGYVGIERIAECIRLHPLIEMDNMRYEDF